ncbi:MAG TPA: MFS transporter [Anaerolineaceae bacterium]|nr:MFS transporter [Anaerolineaceae bacterium]
MYPNKLTRNLLFASLYFTQGTILGYFASLNALYLISRGLTMTDVGVFGAIALIPFIIKIFLGMLSDRVNLFGRGHRAPYILIGLAVQLACLLAVPAINPKTNYWGFVALAFLLQLGMALYDTCTDGLALDTTPPAEQGNIQGFMVGGRAIGTIVAASAVGLLAEKVSWNSVFWVLAVLTLLPLPLVFGLKENERPAEKRFDWKAFGAFKQWPVIAVGLVGLIIFMVIVGANQLINPFLEEALGISLSQAGYITSLWGIGVVAGSIVGAWLKSNDKDIRATLTMLGMVAVALLAIALLIKPGLALPLAIAIVIIYGIAYGAAQTITFALCMRFVDPRIAASMFAILMAFTNVGQGIGLGLGGAAADAIGFNLTFVAFAVLLALVLPFLPSLAQRLNAKSSPDAMPE